MGKAQMGKEEPLHLEKRDRSLPNSALIELLQAVLSSGSRFRLQVKGSSMTPFIREGDILTIVPQISLRPYRYGQVIAFIHPQNGRLMIHRVVGKKGTLYLAQGDNLSEVDGLISGENILGPVTAVERDGRRVSVGRGPERFLIAFLSRQRLFSPLASLVWRIIRPMRKKGMKRRLLFGETRKEEGGCS